MDPLSPDQSPVEGATPRHPFDPSPRTLRLLDSGVQMELGDPSENELTYLERTLCQVSLPYRNPGPDVGHWVRRNGNLQLTAVQVAWPMFRFDAQEKVLLLWASDTYKRHLGRQS